LVMVTALMMSWEVTSWRSPFGIAKENFMVAKAQHNQGDRRVDFDALEDTPHELWVYENSLGAFRDRDLGAKGHAVGSLRPFWSV